MTAYQPLVGKLFLRTKLQLPTKDVIEGVLAVENLKSQSVFAYTELLTGDLKLFTFRITVPSKNKTQMGDILTVVNTTATVVNVGDTLKVVGINESPIELVNKLTGTKLTLVSNALRYSLNV